ncbi:DUF4232 domain-containing protein [Streptomyces sp. NPDC050439]|uniref:DUF4232 domain-containing protein n=1 Tax=unclassified Streptomyces TaxID=2593676 RepID=UPI0034398CA5
MRTTARTTRAALAVAALAALSLSLTACYGDSGSAEGRADGARSGSGGDGASGAGKASATASGGPESESPAPAADGDCTPRTAEISMEDTGGTAPVVLLKITNNGGKACAVLGAPLVSDPTAGKNLPVAQKTRPRSVVRLAPDRSAYAAVNLASIDAERTHRSKKLGVTLVTKGGKATDGHVTVNSPGAAGLLLDAGSRVTYWQNNLEDAMS